MPEVLALKRWQTTVSQSDICCVLLDNAQPPNGNLMKTRINMIRHPLLVIVGNIDRRATSEDTAIAQPANQNRKVNPLDTSRRYGKLRVLEENCTLYRIPASHAMAGQRRGFLHGLGFMCLQLLSALGGAGAVMVDIDPARREAALKAGALAAIDGAAPDATQQIIKALGGSSAYAAP